MKRKERAAKRAKTLYMGKKVCLSIVFVFLAVYMISMLFVTWREEQDIEEEYGRMLINTIGAFENYSFVYEEKGYRVSSPTGPEYNEGYLEDAMNSWGNSDQSGYYLMSGAIYDAEGNLLMQSSNCLRVMVDDWEALPYIYVNLDELLTEDEIRQLADFERVNAENAPEEGTAVPQYEFEVLLNDGNIPAQIRVNQIHWKTYTVREEEEEEMLEKIQSDLDKEDGDSISSDSDDTNQTISSSEPDGMRTISVKAGEEEVWRWENPSAPQAGPDERWQSAEMDMPGMYAGYHTWEKWIDDPFFQDYPEKFDLEKYKSEPGMISGFWEQTGSNSRYEIRTAITPPYQSEPYERYALVLRIEEHPWMAALDSQKYIWLGNLIFLAACAAFTLWLTERTYRQRERLEAQRRDFINIMAHEIKTPLGVIRGFSENMKENPGTKKREYYLDQIIRQTEEVDSLVKEMITTSKAADWKQVKIGDVLISVRSVIEDEMDRLEVQTEEKRLNVTLRCEDDWMLPADRKLLEQAFFAILSNAVSYNREEGRIRIVLKKGICTIENTGDNIPPEHLPHVCEMFYTVNQSRGAREKHLGMGLYLARQIFAMHGAELKVENTEEGVRVTVEKKRSNRDKV